MGKSPRCLFDCEIDSFLEKEKESVFGVLCERYHGDALTTTRDAWLKEIEILQKVLRPWKGSNGQIILEFGDTVVRFIEAAKPKPDYLKDKEKL